MIQLDHSIVSSHHKAESARQLAELLGVPWGVAPVGPFVAVYVNEGLTLDFIDTDEDFPIQHYCFRVSDAEFDAIFDRIKEARLKYGSSPESPDDGTLNHWGGGRGVYFTDPDGHLLELMTVPQ